MKARYTLLLGLFVLQAAVIPAEMSGLEFYALPLEDKLEVYFDTYRDGHTYLGGLSSRAGYIASHGLAVIPYLKKYLEDADYFSLHKSPPAEANYPDYKFKGEPNDITLTLIAYIWMSLHTGDSNEYNIGGVYTLNDEDIQWFIDEYKKRIDDYILATRMIDATVLSSEWDLFEIAWVGRDNKSKLPQYGHPSFGDKLWKYCGKDLKEYYEKRLGVSGLTVVPPFVEE